MKKDKKRKLIAMKIFTILLLAISLASVSFACTAYAETTQRKETIVYEKVDGILKQIGIITQEEDPQEFREQQRKVAINEREDGKHLICEELKQAIVNAIEKLTKQASECFSNLTA